MITDLNNFLINEASSTAKSTALLKQYLKDKYNIKAKVKSESYSGGSSLRVSYIGGPDDKIVSKDLSRLQYGSFDGMEDLYNYKDKSETGIRLNDTDLETYKHVFVKQELTDDIYFRMAKLYSEEFNFSELPKLTDISQFRETFDKPFNSRWNWSELIRYMVRDTNFVTDDLENIILLEIQDLNNPYFIYEYKGKKYRTDKFETMKNSVPVSKTIKPQKSMEKEPLKRERTAKLNNIKLIDYTDRSIAVIGSTFEIKDKLKELGGKFNKFLTINDEKVAGWIFPKTKEDAVANVLAEYE